MQGILRRVVYAVSFEGIGLAITWIGFAHFSGEGGGHSGALALAVMGAALGWNLLFNAVFERAEAWRLHRSRALGAQRAGGRGLGVRLAHALGYEAGLLVLLVPLVAWWLDVSLLQALLLDIGLALFFLVYVFLFNLGFDRLFGLPLSAQPIPSPQASRLARCA